MRSTTTVTLTSSLRFVEIVLYFPLVSCSLFDLIVFFFLFFPQGLNMAEFFVVSGYYSSWAHIKDLFTMLVEHVLGKHAVIKTGFENETNQGDIDRNTRLTTM